MSGVLDTLDVLPDAADPIGRGTADVREAPSIFDTIKASRRMTIDDIPGVGVRGQHDAYQQVFDALTPDAQARIRQNRARSQRTDINEWHNLIWTEATRSKMTVPGAFKELPLTQDQFNKQILDKAKADRAKDRDVTSRGGFGANLIGGIAGSFEDPINIASMMISGGGSTIAKAAGREALINAGVEAVELPFIASQRQLYGEELTAKEAAMNLLFAGGAGLLFGGGTKAIEIGAPKVAPKLQAAFDKVTSVLTPLTERLRAGEAIDPGQVRIATAQALDAVPDEDLPDLIRAVIPEEMMTPSQVDALHVLDRDNEVKATSPFAATHEGDAEHQTRLDEAITAMMQDQPPAPVRPVAMIAPPTPSLGSSMPALTVGGGAADAFKARVRRAESGGNDAAKNPLSSATGRYQFTQGTWLSYYRRAYGNTGETQAAILAKRADGATQERLMDMLTADNGRALARGGVSETSGNLYLAHFAGPDGAVKLHKADPATPARAVLGDAAVKANPFLADMTARDVIAWAHRKMGEPVIDGARPVLREDQFGADFEAWRQAQNEADSAAMERARMAAEDEARARSEQGLEPIEAAPIGNDIELQAWDQPADVQLRAYIADKTNPLRPDVIEKRTGIPAADAKRVLDDLAKAGDAGIYRSESGNIRRGVLTDRPDDLLRAIARDGGILRPKVGNGDVKGWASLRDQEVGRHDLIKGRGMDRWVEGNKRLFQKGGKTIDELGEWMWDNGWWHGDRPSEADVLDILERITNGGEKIYKDADLGRVSDMEADAELQYLVERYDSEIDNIAVRDGISFDPMDRKQIMDLAIYRDVDLEDAVDFVIASRFEDVIRDAANYSDDPVYDIYDQMELEGYVGSPYSGRGAQGDPGPTTDAGNPAVGPDSPEQLRGPAESEGGPPSEAALAALDRIDTPEGVQAEIDSIVHDLEAAVDADELGLAGGYAIDENGDVKPIADILGEIDDELNDIAAIRACMNPKGGAA